MATTPLAEIDDVVAIWRPTQSPAEDAQLTALIAKASAKLRHAAAFDIDARMALWAADPTQLTALDPSVVADVVATVVARFLRNPDGFAATHEGVGPFSKSATFVNRYDKTGSDVRGTIKITDSDLAELRPAIPAEKPFAFQVGIAAPSVVIPGFANVGTRSGISGPNVGPTTIPDYTPGSGVE